MCGRWRGWPGDTRSHSVTHKQLQHPRSPREAWCEAVPLHTRARASSPPQPPARHSSFSKPCFRPHCGLNVRVPPEFRHRSPVPSVMVPGGGAFGRGLGHQGEPQAGLVPLLEETGEMISASREDTACPRLSTNLEEGPHQEPTTLAPWSQTPASRTARNQCLD